MKQVIYSIYIDIPQEELDWQPPYVGETESKNDKTKRELARYCDWLTTRQKQYAESIGVDYVQFTDDDMWKQYKKDYQQRYPFLTTYNIVNFYKIHLMYFLAGTYDEILYIDLDVVPATTESFFDAWDLSNGVAILKNEPKIENNILQMRRYNKKRELKDAPLHSIRSPTAKYWNCYALLEREGFYPKSDVYNTGIVGINRQLLQQLDYFKDFDYILDLMTELKTEDGSMYPKWVQEIFGWDNETVWGFKMLSNNVPKQWLDDKWHYFMDQGRFIPSATKMVHVINKEFGFVKEWYEENRL